MATLQPGLCRAIVDRFTFNGIMIETGTAVEVSSASAVRGAAAVFRSLRAGHGHRLAAPLAQELVARLARRVADASA